MVAVSAAQLRAIPEVIAIPYGLNKQPAVLAALRSGLVDSVVTHATLAAALLDSNDPSSRTDDSPSHRDSPASPQERS
jgi:DNA-binding transcriptional regulator LsrR (DeoR family)